ncbi:Pre-mRNA-splicing factor of RES complex-domain-containing protein [Phlyctochytrium arcticum]|nr:Pre-mRNA-splicing factor of RES complex-domain-containing protein [Phlyctochytrium arcticum]
MDSKKEYLRKYMSNDSEFRVSSDGTIKKKKKKRNGAPDLASTTRILDEDADLWGVDRNKEDEEDTPLVVDEKGEEIDVTAAQRQGFTAASWEVVREGEAPPSRGRASPSPSPVPEARSRKRASPSPSPEPAKQKKKRRKSPSPSPSPERTSSTHASASTFHPTTAGNKSSFSQGGSEIRLSDGRLAGLQKGSAIRADAESRAKANAERLAKLDPAATGQHAETVHRSKHGKKVDMAAQKAELMAQRRAREAEEEKNMVWGKGYTQAQQAAKDAKKLAEEESRPLAVYVDDTERNAELQERDRWGDPMAFMIADSKRKKKVQERPKYMGPPPPPNRYGILPGYRWDGVDRSNGFEGRMFKERNERKGRELEAYKWSSEDM